MCRTSLSELSMTYLRTLSILCNVCTYSIVLFPLYGSDNPSPYQNRTVLKENYPKYIISYMPISLAGIIIVLLLSVLIR